MFNLISNRPYFAYPIFFDLSSEANLPAKSKNTFLPGKYRAQGIY